MEAIYGSMIVAILAVILGVITKGVYQLGKLTTEVANINGSVMKLRTRVDRHSDELDDLKAKTRPLDAVKRVQDRISQEETPKTGA